MDDQYLATVVRYNLDFLELCPLLVDVTILDAKGGNVTTTVSAEPGSCRCNPTAPRPAIPVRLITPIVHIAVIGHTGLLVLSLIQLIAHARKGHRTWL